MMHLHRVSILFAALVALTSQASDFGRFEGTVQTEWLPDGRKMRLIADFSYFDPSDVKWQAPKGAIVDGASIPKVFWQFIGGPFEGKYRFASVVHDVACEEKSRRWKAVHRMFYNASRLGGVGLVHALVMYGGVYHFGPRWPWPDPPAIELLIPHQLIIPVAFVQTLSASKQETEARRLTTNEDFLRMRAYIIQLRGDLTLEQVEEFSSEFLKKVVPKVPPPVKLSPDVPL